MLLFPQIDNYVGLFPHSWLWLLCSASIFRWAFSCGFSEKSLQLTPIKQFFNTWRWVVFLFRGMGNCFALPIFSQAICFLIAKWDIFAIAKMENTTFSIQIMASQLDKPPEVGLLFRHEHHCPAAVFLVLDLVSSSYPLLNPQDLHVRGNGRDLIPLALTYSFDWDPTSSSPCSDGEHGHKDAMG